MKKILLIICAIVFVWGIAFLRSGRPVGGTGTVLFNVALGEGVKDIAAGLKEAKLIRNERYFLLLVWRRGTATEFKVGSYELAPTMSAGEIERALTGGMPVTNEAQVTILEGWTLDDIAAYLERQGIATVAAFQAEAGRSAAFVKKGELPDWAASFSALSDKPATASLEGYLFPDTYRIYPDAGARGLVERMLENFERKLTSEWRAEIVRQKKDIFDVVIMASILEREVRHPDDMAMVADVFWKREEAGRGLEADSTVNYVTDGNDPSISYQDTKIDSPWNTYKYRGLPAGPIGNPGEAALRAAIFPTPNPFWYFLTDKEGNVHYGRTLQEHNANKAKYLR